MGGMESERMSKMPKAKAREIPGRGAYAHTTMYVVDHCPYCGQSHRHYSAGPGDELIREADCFRGQYKLELDEPQCLDST